jgi:hypothetical protein
MMDVIAEIFTGLIFQRIIVGIFGYYTLYTFYKLLGDEKGILWLESKELGTGNDFGRGCLIRLAGLVSFCLFCLIILIIAGLIL